jgi:hypothetical protein
VNQKATDQSTRQQRVIIYSRGGSVPSNAIRLKDGELPPFVLNDRSIRVWACTKHSTNKYDDAKGEAHLQFKVDAVPGLNLQEIIGVEVRKAQDENKRLLVTNSSPEGSPIEGVEELLVMNGARAWTQYGGSGSLFMRYHPLAFKTEGIRPKQLTELSGIVVAHVLTPPEAIFTIADITNTEAKHVATESGIRCEVTGTRKSTANTMTLALQLQMDLGLDVLDMPIQVRGRARPFIRVQRGGGELGNGLPKVIITDQTGKVLKHAVTNMSANTDDGIRMLYAIDLRIDQPEPTDRLSLTIEARRPTTIEMPFTLKNVPLP